MMTRGSTIVGVFSDKAQAERAIDMLTNAGIPSDHISYSGKLSGGLLASIKSMFTGQESADVVRDELINRGIARDEADYYVQEHQAGRFIVAVHDEGRRGQDVMNILQSNGAYNYRSRATQMGRSATGMGTASTTTTTSQTTGATGYTRTSATGMTGERMTGENVADLAPGEKRSMKLREEQLQAEKERVQTGEVRLHKDIVTEKRDIDVPVTREEVIVEQRTFPPREVAPGTPLGNDEVIRVPVSEEQVNVTKNTVVTGEVEVGKRKVEETKRVSDTVRREEARLEQEGNPRIRGDIEQEKRTLSEEERDPRTARKRDGEKR